MVIGMRTSSDRILDKSAFFKKRMTQRWRNHWCDFLFNPASASSKNALELFLDMSWFQFSKIPLQTDKEWRSYFSKSTIWYYHPFQSENVTRLSGADDRITRPPTSLFVSIATPNPSQTLQQHEVDHKWVKRTSTWKYDKSLLFDIVNDALRSSGMATVCRPLNA